MTRALVAVALVLGALAAFAGDPVPGGVATPRTISALDLAAGLRARAFAPTVLDLRSPAAWAAGHVATAQPAAALPAAAGANGRATIVLYGDDDAAAHAAARTLLAAGHRDVRVLVGGYGGWLDEVLAPTLDPSLPAAEGARIAELSRYFGGRPRIGSTSGARTRPPLPGRGC